MKSPKLTDAQMTKYIEDYIREDNLKRDIVRSKEYIEWLYNYVLKNKWVQDEHMLYNSDGKDKENSLLLSWFFSYIKELAHKSNSSIDYGFDGEETIIFKIKDELFRITEIFGQGCVTSVSLYKPLYVELEI